MGRMIELSDIGQLALLLARAERDLVELDDRLERSKREALEAWEREHADELRRHAELSATVARYREQMRLTVDYVDAEVEHGRV